MSKKGKKILFIVNDSSIPNFFTYHEIRVLKKEKSHQRWSAHGVF